MLTRHDKLTIVSMAVIASALATLLHEGLGHGAIAWMRGDIPTELTSNHLSSLRPDHWVEAGGTLVNLLVGALSLIACRHVHRGNPRYFLWLLSALNLLPGAGYFLLSGIFGFGDWHAVTADLPYQVGVRIGMTLFGAGLYVVVVKQLANAVRPFVPDRPTYNTVGRLPYYAAGLFSCVAGALDPFGVNLLLVSTIPAAFGGSSGLMWADSLMPLRSTDPILSIHRAPAWWVAAAVLGTGYILILGRGMTFAQ